MTGELGYPLPHKLLPDDKRLVINLLNRFYICTHSIHTGCRVHPVSHNNSSDYNTCSKVWFANIGRIYYILTVRTRAKP